MVATSEKIGDNLEGIAYLNGYLYVCNSCKPGETYTYYTEVVKLDASTLNRVGTITVHENPTSIVTDDKDLYVCCQGNYDDKAALVQKISGATNEVSNIVPGNMISITANTLYIINAPWGATPTYTAYNTSNGNRSTFIAGTEIFAPCAIQANPLTGDVYITSYSKGDYGYANYEGKGYMVKYSSSGQFLKQYEVGVGPATMKFNYHVEYPAY